MYIESHNENAKQILFAARKMAQQVKTLVTMSVIPRIHMMEEKSYLS